MAYFLVYLVDAKKHAVVPEKFVYGLVDVKLKNQGVNANQNHLIYSSQEYFELLKNGDVVESEYEPKFYLPVTKNYPLKDDIIETCFIGRTKKFHGM